MINNELLRSFELLKEVKIQKFKESRLFLRLFKKFVLSEKLM